MQPAIPPGENPAWTTTSSILVIGGGPAGTFAAIAAKKQDPSATVMLLSEEHCEPYEKPPLSKGVLLGKAQPGDALIAGPQGIAGHNVVLEARSRCVALDRLTREVVLEDGRRLHYDALVIATGSSAREIPQLPLGTPRVHYLRTEADASALNKELGRARDLLVIGAGLIGLEVAASAAELGVKTTVLEVAPRILSRVCDEETGAMVHEVHRRHGVDIRLGTGLVSASAETDGRIVAVTTAGDSVGADLVVVGTGAKPDDRLAAASGLATDDGIVVDEQCRTSDPVIFAAGDVVRFPGPHGPIRLENWRHAQDQGMVAGRNAAGARDPYVAVPSFWSEQYDLYIQGVGWPSPGTERVRRPHSGGGALVFEVAGDHLVYAMGINAQRDLALVRRLIERRVPVDPAALADPGQPLAAMLKR
jgi:NADPH-dependent 2,4-dienoyl-CoA reductase/sulfur reductase-like enzyme